MPNTTNNKSVHIISPHSPYLYKLHYDFNWQQLKPVCERMIEGNAKIPILKNGKSSYTHKVQPHQHLAFADFYDWLIEMVRIIAQQSMGISFTDTLKVANSWINLQEYGGHTTEHNHAHVCIGVSTYLHMPKDGGYFECKDPLELLKSANYHIDPNWAWKEVPTVSGDILVFPSWLIHRTQENKTNEGRWVLTTNFVHNFQ